MDIRMNESTSDALVVMVLDTKEDSMDIYDGLDNDPSNNREKSTDAFQLKESMDLYEEIVTEEQQNRESTYLELMSRFQAAQTQIKELHKRLEQMELQNTRLNTENCRLKKNISALLQTARQEVTRKDAEIQRLNQRINRGGSHMNYLGDKGQSRRFSPEISTNRQPPSAAVPPALPQPPNNPRPALPPPPTSPPRKDHSVPETSQSSHKESTSPACTLSGASKASLYSHSKSSSKGKSPIHHSDLSKQKSTHREEKHHPQSESSDREHRSSDYSKDCSGSEKKGCKLERSTGRSNPGSCENRNYSNNEEHHRSHRKKSPPLKNSKDITSSTEKKGRHKRRHDTAKCSTTDSEHHACKKSYHRADIKEQRIRSSDKKEQKNVSPRQHCVCQRASSKERTSERPSKSDPRREDRLHADKPNRKCKRSTSSERSNSCAKRSSKDRDSCKKERKNLEQDVLKHICDTPNVTEKKSAKECSPHRKLCFMETLNLTRSPIKKPALSSDGNSTSAVIEKEPSSIDGSELDIENMHIIDEVSGSELEAGSEDVVEQPQKSKDPQSKSCEDDTCVQAKDHNGGESIVSDQQLEEHHVQTVSAYVQPNRMEEDQKSDCLTHTSPDSSSFQAGGLASDQGHIEMASSSHIDKSESLQPTAGVNDCSSSPKNNFRNGFDSSIIANDSYVTGSSPKQAHSSKITVLKNDKEHAPASQLKEHSTINSAPDAACLQSQEPCPPATCSIQEKDSDVVSSTISLESLPQEGLSLPDAIYILTQTDEPASDVVSTTNKAGCLTGCDAVSKISSTTQELILPDTDGEPSVTPEKSLSPGKSHENNFEPPSSKPFLHDEDSMTRILSNLKMIPDAISPLRSPIQTSKRSHVCAQSKPGHVKSLEKEFSNTAVEGTTKKLDVNKENKYPGSPAKHEAQSPVDKGSTLPSNLSDTELEEGEILSEGEDTATDSPVPAPERPKLARPVKNKASPKTVWNKTSKEKCATSKEANLTSSLMSHSPKSRFKTVCPAATKLSFSTVDEVMDTFRLVRAEIRKKYMKLHKTFPRKSFYGVMDNFQESFLKFVEGAYLGRICTQQDKLKSKLKKVITSVFRKLSNNGIVKRIFEQQAVDLKQKLWDFVDVQVDYLFRKMSSTLKAFCKRAATEAEEKRSSKIEDAAKQALTTDSTFQLKEQQPPTNPKQLKPCSVVPYKTGLGSRGKDLRNIHVDKEKKAEPLPKGGSNTQSAASLQMPMVVPGTPEKSNSFVLAPTGSLHDKTDLELLTEQQASSLTYNLIEELEMGEIFLSLLEETKKQEASNSDSTLWSLGTPRKDGQHLISISTPSKFDSPAKFLSKLDTPSKLIASRSSISPHKEMSPLSKAPLPFNPAVCDESCLLEVPSESRAQSSCSLLAEDLAVSLTNPSPLKSDSYLSFLRTANVHAMSTPDSVISAHISEDALMDGEDATEQDIHLALDTDNSSSSSSSSSADSKVSGILATPFVFKPHQPMEALVMERSNDHFIVKIRQAAVCADAVPADGSSGCATTAEFGQPHPEVASSQILPDKSSSSAQPPEKKHLQSLPDSSITESCSWNTELQSEEEQSTSRICLPVSGETTSEPLNDLPTPHSSDCELQNNVQTCDRFCKEISPSHHSESAVESAGTVATQIQEEVLRRSPDTASAGKGPHQPTDPNKKTRQSATADPERCERGPSHSARDDGRSSPGQRDCLKAGKRKAKQEKLVRKRCSRQQQQQEEKEEEEEEGQDNDGSKSSPNSLYAKNVIKKKGAVVMSWTRDEDRAILMELKAKGASSRTFSALSGKLKKPSGQISQRFYQLMKLYQKQGKTDT